MPRSAKIILAAAAALLLAIAVRAGVPAVKNSDGRWKLPPLSDQIGRPDDRSPGAGGGSLPGSDAGDPRSEGETPGSPAATWDAFAEMLAAALGLDEHNEAVLPPFRPGERPTRAEVAGVLVRALDLEDVAHALAAAGSGRFSDVADHPAQGAVELLYQLGVLAPGLTGTFGPDEEVTTAELASMVDQAARLHTVQGQVQGVLAETRTITVRTGGDELRTLALPMQVVVLRNGEWGAAGDVGAGDQVTVVADRYGSARVIRAIGAARNDVVARLGRLLKEVLTPEETQALLRGDWEAVSNVLRTKLYNQLLGQGVSPAEAAAILEMDWSALSDLGRQRVIEALSERFGVSAELAEALAANDWDKARELAQTEALQHLLGTLLLN